MDFHWVAGFARTVPRRLTSPAAGRKVAAMRAPAPLTRFSHWLGEQMFLLNQHRRLRRIEALRAGAADPAALLDAVRRMQLTFTITAGRTGTTYLTRLGELFPGTVSLHEPDPSYVYFLRQVQRRPALARRFWLEYKLPFIAALAGPRYIETSHLFCKGFLDSLLELGVRPGIILLRRHPRPIATSLLTRHTVPGRGRLGRKYLVHPGDPGVLALPGWQALTSYQLCFWYALEIERRQRLYGERLAALGTPLVDITAEELHDPARFLAAGERLGLLAAVADRETLLRRHAEVSARGHNINPTEARAVADPEAEEREVWRRVEPAAPWLREAVARRYATPAAAALTPQVVSRP